MALTTEVSSFHEHDKINDGTPRSYRNRGGGGDEYTAFDIDVAVVEVKLLIEDAVNFIKDDMEPLWADAERYFNGEGDIPKVAGRSQVSTTEVRDSVRSLMPSIMRVFTQSGSLCEYISPTVDGGQMASSQTMYVNQLFWNSNGYMVLQDAVHDACLRKVGIVKSWWADKKTAEYMSVTGITQEQLDHFEEMEDVFVVEVMISEEGADDASIALESAIDLFDVELAVMKEGGTLTASHVPLHGFFVDDVATNPSDATIIGQRQNMAVGDVIAMGLEHDDWHIFDGLDLEQDGFSDESEQRRGYIEEQGDDNRNYSSDPMMRKILITEAYARYDLDGTGVPQLYRFWLGGTIYAYIDHERVPEVPYHALQIDSIPDAFFGRSIFDILADDQDTGTSLLRATCDNAHLSNNKRLAVHETMVNIDDVLNNTLGYPIRVRAPGMIQEIGVQSSVGVMLPLLQYLKTNTENKVGVTAAAQGLDPDALQSTDKDAVRNTIALAQGQVELMCRNLAETGVRSLFTSLLKLSLAHLDDEQSVMAEGKQVPVSQKEFDPELKMVVKVGIGNASFELKMVGLEKVLAQQKEIIASYGLDNQIVTPQNMFNTIADMTRMHGLNDVTRYFNVVTPEMAQQMQQKATQAAKEASGKPDAATAIVKVEEIKSQTAIQTKQMDMEIQAGKSQSSMKTEILKGVANDDLQRDKMAQDLEIAVGNTLGGAATKLAVVAEQARTRPPPAGTSAALQSAKPKGTN
jgi:hypothetical protein